MCFHTELKATATTMKSRFKASFPDADNFESSVFSGFNFPATPIILNKQPNTIIYGQWGLIPSWATTDFNAANTLNARVETYNDKPSFAPYAAQRCLILSTGFYEWKWLDAKGKRKEKFFIQPKDYRLFAFAGLYNPIIEPKTQVVLNTYTILTTAADEVMSEIHNTKKRMPIVLSPEEESLWLSQGLTQFEHVTLVGQSLDNQQQGQLFMNL